MSDSDQEFLAFGMFWFGVGIAGAALPGMALAGWWMTLLACLLLGLAIALVSAFAFVRVRRRQRIARAMRLKMGIGTYADRVTYQYLIEYTKP